MTRTYRAIGKYEINAPVDEQIRALRECVETIAYELLERGVDEDEVRDWFESAADGAALDYDSDKSLRAAE